MGKYIMFILMVMLLVVMGCSGKEMVNQDQIPPTKPDLVPHLGDTGDLPDSVFYNDAWVYLTDDENGVDAVPDVDGIKIMWSHLLDLDLDKIDIWRFNDYSEPTVIASVPATREFFTDIKNVTMNGDSLFYTYSYFIEVFDRSGNSTISDTVSYRILEKQITVSPANGAVISTMANLHFVFDRSGNATKFRVLLFDDFHTLLWSQNYEGPQETTYSIPYTGSMFVNKTMLWRVDALEWDSTLNMYVGSESQESTFTVQ